MIVKSKLNWLTQMSILVLIFAFIRLTFKPEMTKLPSISVVLPGLALFFYSLFTFYIAFQFKKQATDSFKVKTKKIIPIMIMLIAGFLLAFQALIFISQKDSGYHLYYFIMNTGMFSSFVLLSIYSLIFTNIYVIPDGIFFKRKIITIKYNVTYNSNKIELTQKDKLSYLSYISISGEESELQRLYQLIKLENQK